MQDNGPTPPSHAPVRFGVIGCGSLAQASHLPNLVKFAKTELVMCCDLSEEILAFCRHEYGATRTTTDFHAVVNDPEVDAICLATTENLRLPVIEAAAAHGKPVYVEKPMAASLEETLQIQAVVNESGIPFCVGHNRRNSPAMIDARRMFRQHMGDPQPCPWRYDREGPARKPQAEEGAAGITYRINDDWYSWKAWAFDDQTAAYGPLIFEMTHFVDVCNWFLAAEPAEVVCIESGPLNHGVVIRYKTGELATITMCGNGTFGYPKELVEAMGQGGIVVVDHMVEVRTAGIAGAPAKTVYPLLEDDPYPGVGPEGGIEGWLAKRRKACEDAAAAGDTSKVMVANPDKGHTHALDRFVDEIRGMGPMVCGVDDAALATRVALAAVKSAHEHRFVSMDEVR